MGTEPWVTFRAVGPQGVEADEGPAVTLWFPATSYAAVWYEDTLVEHQDGRVTLQRAEMKRPFSGDRHGDPLRACLRWVWLMGRRHERAWVRTFEDGREPVDSPAERPEDLK